jgi:ketosteroid isomerase-like protein
MSTSPDTFDALAVVVDWLDAGQSADLDALLNLYGDDATLACDCEGVILTWREALSAY